MGMTRTVLMAIVLRNRKQWQTTVVHCQVNLMDRLILETDMVLDDETPRSEGIFHATGEERRDSSSRCTCNDMVGSKPSGSPAIDVGHVKRRSPSFIKRKSPGFIKRKSSGFIKRKSPGFIKRKSLSFMMPHNIATWNVRSMNVGKLDIVKREMERNKIGILGISELKWVGMGHFHSDDYKVFFSGHQTMKRNGVALILRNELANSVLGYNPVCDRIISLRILAHPTNITIIQIYAPTSDAEEEDLDEFYGILQEVVNATCKQDVLFIMGDWNAKVGDTQVPGVTGKHGLGARNDSGERLLEFCEENSLFVANTCFQQPKRRLYTWTSPNGQYRNQIDYILGSRRWRSAVQLAKTLPGADCGTDHELLLARIRIKLKKVIRQGLPAQFDLENIPLRYTVEVKNRFSALSLADKEPDELWEEVRDIIKETAKCHVPKPQKKKKTHWLSEKAIEIAVERRKAKAKGSLQEVRLLNAKFQRQARQDKEAYLRRQCQDIEIYNKLGKTRDLFRKIQEISGKFIPRVSGLKSKHGKDIIEEEMVKKRWREYTEDLYKRDENMSASFNQRDFDDEPVPLESEVRWALGQISNRKAPGTDGIGIELIKQGGDEAIKVLTHLCQLVWKSITWPEEWKRSVFIPIPKKGDSRVCENNRTIALIPHASKVLLKILQKRLEPYLEREMPQEQAGFRRGRGTRDQICNIRWLMEKAREYQKEVFLCFIDYRKAFDCVDHGRLWNVLSDMGVPMHLILLMKHLYDGQKATVRTEFGETEWFSIKKGVRQGCILSPYLFNMYSEYIMRRAGLDETSIGVKIAGLSVNNLRYADDTTLLAETHQDLVELIKKVKQESLKFGLALNIKKTKVMSTAPITTFQVDDESIDVVNNFILLGSNIESDCRCAGEIRRRLALARCAMTRLAKIMKDQNVTQATKVRLVNTLVFPVALYGCESWTVRRSERRKIDAFELWTWRRLLRVPWTEKQTNKSILAKIQPNCSLEAIMTKLKLKYFGHVMRAHESLENSLMLGKIEGRRRRGRQRMRWIDGIQEATGLTMQELRQHTSDRKKWRAFVHWVTRSRKRLDGT